MRDYILLFTSYFNKMKDLQMVIDNEYLLFVIIQSLLAQYDTLRTSLNTKSKGWSVYELIAIFIKKEDYLKNSRTRSVVFIGNKEDQTKKLLHKKDKTLSLRVRILVSSLRAQR